jgi:HEPN domain-containing protein
MPSEIAAAWIRKAENDLLAVDNNLASAQVPFDVVCYHCQQVAEKYLKALLVSLGVQPSRTHDLLALLQDVRTYLTETPSDQIENSCIILNPYAIEVRYPDNDSNPTTEDCQEARSAAETVRQWARGYLLR